MVGLTKDAALDYASSSIRINAICPGIIDTEMMQRFTGRHHRGPGRVIAQEPIGRMGTPLSAEEELRSGGGRLIIGTGAYGSLPIMPQVLEGARRRGVELAAIPTEDACRLIASLDRREVHAVLHVTC